MYSEDDMNELVENYLQLLQEDQIITEDVRSFLGHLTSRKLSRLKDYLSKAFKRKDKICDSHKNED